MLLYIQCQHFTNYVYTHVSGPQVLPNQVVRARKESFSSSSAASADGLCTYGTAQWLCMYAFLLLHPAILQFCFYIVPLVQRIFLFSDMIALTTTLLQQYAITSSILYYQLATSTSHLPYYIVELARRPHRRYTLLFPLGSVLCC
jgi:hypothetical protein